jgi:type IV pilus assembly protein PilM
MHMAKRSKTFVGLDIDTSGIAAVEAAHDGRLTIGRVAVAPLESGIVRDGEVVDVEALAAALRALYRENRGLGRRVRVGVANQKIVVRTFELPYFSDRKELEAAVRFHADDQIPMPLDQAILDFQPLDIVESPEGRRQRLLLVAARRDMVTNALSAVRAAGLRPEGIDLSAFAMIRALYQPASADDQVLYVSVAGLTNLAVARGTTCLFTRAASGGIEALAIELAERKALTLDHARGWLEHVGLETAIEEIEGDADIVAGARQVLLEGVRRIAADIRNSLDFHNAQGGSAAVSRAVLSGAAAGVPGFALALGAELGLPVVVGSVEGVTGGLHPGALAVAAGLAVEEVPA